MDNQGFIQLSAIEWAAITAIIAVTCFIIGYFINSWKKAIETNIKSLFTKADKNRHYFEEKATEIMTDSTKCKLNIASNFVRTKDCNDTVKRIEDNQTRIISKMDEMKDTMGEHHSQVMYELGIKNGRKQPPRNNT